MDIDKKIAALEQQLEIHRANAQACSGALQFAREMKTEMEAEPAEEETDAAD